MFGTMAAEGAAGADRRVENRVPLLTIMKRLEDDAADQ